MSKFSNFLNEQVIAKDGNYDFGFYNSDDYSLRRYHKSSIEAIHNYAKFLYEVNYEGFQYVFYKLDSLYILAKVSSESYPTKRNPNETKDRYETVTAMRLLKTNSLNRFKKYKDVHQVKAIEVKSDKRVSEIGKLMYYLVTDTLNYTILGDEEQYENARRMYVSFSKNPGFIVDIVKMGDKIVEENVELYHHNDERIWSKEEDKIGRLNRVVLTRVKLDSGIDVKVKKFK